MAQDARQTDIRLNLCQMKYTTIPTRDHFGGSKFVTLCSDENLTVTEKEIISYEVRGKYDLRWHNIP